METKTIKQKVLGGGCWGCCKCGCFYGIHSGDDGKNCDLCWSDWNFGYVYVVRRYCRQQKGITLGESFLPLFFYIF
uniref:Uncharacterized protein n=1 Tax=Firmicutes phage HS18 TaxID=3056396 RepID=A0AA50ACY6_9VIRU|nr:MAG: hypothetical protein [Firmicutes phage HS18]